MKLKLSPPWVTWANRIKALFKNDKDVFVIFDQENMVITLYVANQEKADAINAIILPEKVFGNVNVKTKVIPGNAEGAQYPNKYKTAFDGNKAFAEFQEIDCPLGHFGYCVWDSVPAQYYNDDLQNPWGYETILIEDIAKDVLKEETGIFHCTNKM